MGKYLKVFDLTSEYQAYVNGPNLILPNVSHCKDNNTKVYYHPVNDNVTPGGSGSGSDSGSGEPTLEGAKILCTYNVSNSNIPVRLYHPNSGSGSGSGSGEAGPMFSLIEVDGVEQEVTTEYTFDTTGEHTVLFTLPEGETSIGVHAFHGCSGITSVTIGNSVTSIGDWAFEGCFGLTSITIPNSVTSIGSGAFSSCSGLTSVTLNSNSIVSNTYTPESNIKNIFGEQVIEYIIGNGVTSIGIEAFYGCSEVTSVTIPNSLTSIDYDAFGDCSGLTSITIPDSVISIGEYAFCDCSGLTSITIPDSVTSIGASAFDGCSSLTSVTIGNSVTSIGIEAFEDCSGLTSITCNATTAPTISYSTFFNVKTGGILTVPAGSTGYDVWMDTGDYYLGYYSWTKVEV